MSSRKKSTVTKKKADPLKGLRRRPDIFTRQVGFDLALYDSVSDRLFLLNPTAASVWYHITPDRSLEAIAGAIAMSYDKSDKEVQEISDDVRWIILQFRRNKLVISKSGKAPEVGDLKGKVAHIPDREIHFLSQGYTRPNFKTYTLAELQEIFHLDDRPLHRFSDTWQPDEPPDLL